MLSNLGPEYALAKDLQKLKDDVARLETQDMLQNASLVTGDISVPGGSININGTGSLFVGSKDLSTIGKAASSSQIAGGDLIFIVSGWSDLDDRANLTFSTPSGKMFVFLNAYLFFAGAGSMQGTFSITDPVTGKVWVDRDVQLSNGHYIVNFLESGFSGRVFGTYQMNQVVTGLPRNTDLVIQTEFYNYAGGAYRASTVTAQAVL